MPRYRRTALVLLVITALAAALGGCSSDESSTPTSPTPSGPTFHFTFPGPDVSHSLTFVTVGSWNYRCVPHASSGMVGTVIVDAASANDSAFVEVDPNDTFDFVPATVTIKSGGVVRWQNKSSMNNHTVTR